MAPRPPEFARTRAIATARRLFTRTRSWLVDETWAVGLVDRPIASFLERPSLADARWLAPPRGGYQADPFGLPDGETILVERFDHATNLGRLEAIGRDGALRDPQPFDPPIAGHASFPFLATGEDGALFCLPETAAAGRLDLWRQGPDGRFRPFVPVAADLLAADPTLFRWDGRWWIAFADARLGAADTLCLLHAEALEGPWRPHAGNPVKRDIGSSRPAGTPFVHEGRLYRPAQDCTGCYGAAIVINRVRTLDPERFAEEPVARIAPDRASPFPHGAHTLVAWGERTLVDAKRHGFVGAAFRRRALARLAPLLATLGIPRRGPREITA
jgi:hypothetical protein